LGAAENFQTTGSKHREVNSEEKKGQWPSKKTKRKQPGKYCRDARVKIGGVNPCERCMCTGQDCLVHNSR